MDNCTPEYLRIIHGYTLVYPLTRDNPLLQYSRIIGLIKEGISVKILTQYMSEDISSIWMQIVKKGPNKLIIGGTYREHRYLHQGDDSSASPQEQTKRWEKTAQQWADAGRGNNCILMGDCNVDIKNGTTQMQIWLL